MKFGTDPAWHFEGSPVTELPRSPVILEDKVHTGLGTVPLTIAMDVFIQVITPFSIMHLVPVIYISCDIKGVTENATVGVVAFRILESKLMLGVEVNVQE